MDRFQPFTPSSHLRSQVHSLVIQEADEARTYAVLPDTALVMGFQFRGRMAYVEPTSGEVVGLQRHGITGLRDRARTFQASAGLGSVLVRFKPLGARGFLRLPAAELREQSLGLDLITDPAGLPRLEDRLHVAASDAERIAAVEAFLTTVFVPDDGDPLVTGALAAIERRGGWLRVRDLVEQLGTSASVLGRRFYDVVGTTPKQYAALVRLHRLADTLLERPENLAEVAMKSGFYDQAHFIHEFKRMTGLTPSAFMEQGRSKDDFLQFLD